MLLFWVFFVRVYHIAGKTSLELGGPRDSSLVIAGRNFFQRTVLKNPDFAQKNAKIGWVSDIHADRFKRRTVDSGTIYPRQYQDYLPKVFDDLRSKGIDTVVATGDNTNSGDDNYARELSKIAQEKSMHVIWVRGNHDNDKVMNVLDGKKARYYYVDYGKTRIVAIDDVEVGGGYQGFIDSEQLAWLRGVLKTDKQVIVAMHIPIFDGGDALNSNHVLQSGNFTNMGNILASYVEFEKVLHESGNVKMVLSGHWHVPWQKQYDGIAYYGQAALTREGYAGSYGVIDLKSDQVEYLFAK